METKICNACYIEKDINDFQFRSHRKYYLNKCKLCKQFENLAKRGDKIKYCKTCKYPLSEKYRSDWCSKECRQKAPALEWTEDLAMLIGLIASDGCLHDNGRVSFTNKDLGLAKLFQALFPGEACLGTITNKKTGNTPYYQVKGTHYGLNSLLKEIGITPRKSLTISKIKIPNKKLFYLFLRGVIEGDGGITNSCINVHSGSKKFISWIKEELEKDYFLKIAIYENKTCFTLSIPRSQSKKLYNLLYNNNYKGLDYKKEKMIMLFNTKCPTCENFMCPTSKKCLKCLRGNGSNKRIKTGYNYKIEWPSTKELLNMLEKSNYSQLGKQLGVSDNAIRKRIKNHPNK